MSAKIIRVVLNSAPYDKILFVDKIRGIYPYIPERDNGNLSWIEYEDQKEPYLVKHSMNYLEGLLLRDEFAAQSMQAIQSRIVKPEFPDYNFIQPVADEVIVECAYAMADAMIRFRIEERQKKSRESRETFK